jgi:heat shock protein HslJ
MRRRSGFLIGLVVACAVLTGCGQSTPGHTPGTDAASSAVPSSGVSPLERQELLGRWVPVLARSDRWHETPYVQFSQDGTWHGTDGCNGLSGRWNVDPDGAFEASSGPSTLIGCDNVNLGRWLVQAQAVKLDGDVLVLRDAKGNETGRLQRSTAPPRSDAPESGGTTQS